jgi:hypothetical protein
MAGSKPEDKKPFDYFRQVEAAQKEEKSSVSNLVSSLRTDMVPASNTEPARESTLQLENLRVIIGIFLGVIVVGLILFLSRGPGRPILEENLAILANKAATPTPTASPTPVPATKTPILPTQTPSASPTDRPTKTPVVAFMASPTARTPTLTPTVPECRDALSITLADVGQTLCVRGVVLETISNPTDFMVVFSYERGFFYWVSYDLLSPDIKPNNCYQIHGTIHQIGNSPMLVFDFKNLPEVCP